MLEKLNSKLLFFHFVDPMMDEKVRMMIDEYYVFFSMNFVFCMIWVGYGSNLGQFAISRE